MSRRLPPQPGEWIDRSRPVHFWFEGQAVDGYAGDVAASALWAADVRAMGRSFKYHRPRSVYSMAGHDANALFETDELCNLRADALPIADGMDLRAVNTVGGLAGDLLRVNELGSAFMPVGFYYKTFHKPAKLFPFHERMIRKISGLGRANPDHRTPVSPKAYDFCDVLVVGAGPAGLSAALAAGEQGLKVLVVDEQRRPGGSLTWQWAGQQGAGALLAKLLAAVEANPNVEVRTGVRAAGWYTDHWVALVDDVKLTKLRAEATIIAAGCIEQPAVFGHNDLPGVMLASAAQRLLRHFAIKPFDRCVVVAANDDGYRAAMDLHHAGVTIPMIVDPRRSPDLGDLGKQATAAGIDIRLGCAVYAAAPGRGKMSIKGADVIELADDGSPKAYPRQRVACDGIAVSVGWAPNVAIAYQAGARCSYDASTHQLRAKLLPETVFIAGRANGIFDLDDQQADGRRAGVAAAIALGKRVDPLPAPVHHGAAPSFPWPIFTDPGKHKAFVDFDEDLRYQDLIDAHQEGFDSVELLKRYSTVGMGPSQGKLSNFNAVRVLAKLNGATIDETGTTTSRPFYQPVSMAMLAGRRFHPLRKTPLHEWHATHGARFVHAGAWLRPDWYDTAGGVAGEDIHSLAFETRRDDAVFAEAQHVRKRVGVIDVGTLGKFYVAGRDAVAFLERIYTGRFADQKIGRMRYALACDETGVIVDDGVIARLSEDRFYVSATTGGAAAFFREMQRWAQIWSMNVTLSDVTGAYGAMNIAGPRSRDMLKAVTDLDLTREAFPSGDVREAVVAGVRVLVMRVGFVDREGYEIHAPANLARHVWRAIYDVGQAYQIRPFGLEAQRLLRLEMGHPIVSLDTDALTTPAEAGLNFAVTMSKPFFVGQRSLQVMTKEPIKRVLFAMTFAADEPVLPRDCNLIIEGGRIVGRITSIAKRTTLGKPIALGFVEPRLSKPGNKVRVRLDNGSMVEARVTTRPFSAAK